MKSENYNFALFCFNVACVLGGKAVAWNNKGWAELFLKRYMNALGSLFQAEKYDPNMSSIWINRGEVMNNLERYDEALIALNRALEIEPESSNAFQYRSITNFKLGNREHFESDLINLIQLNPDSHFGHCQLAQIQIGKFIDTRDIKYLEFAELHNSKAIRLDSMCTLNITRSAVILAHQDQWEDAVNKAKTLFNSKGKPTKSVDQVHSILSSFYLQGKQYKEARENIDQAILKDPSVPYYHMTKARIEHEEGNNQQALEIMTQPFVLENMHAIAWNNLGCINIELGNYEQAEIALNKAIDMRPKFGNPWHFKAKLELQKENHLKALEYVNEALTRQPTNSNSQKLKEEIEDKLRNEE